MNNVSDFLYRMGADPSLDGYKYTVSAVELVMKDARMLHPVIKGVYTHVGNEFGVTPYVIERSIRHMIEKMMTRGNQKVINDILGNYVLTETGKPTVSTFIGVLAEYIQNYDGYADVTGLIEEIKVLAQSLDYAIKRLERIKGITGGNDHEEETQD